MPTFKGFNTIGQYKKFSLVDRELIMRDLLNAFLIREGSMPGRPDIGTSIWSFVFEPNDQQSKDQVEEEVTRIVNADPRLSFESVNISAGHNTVVVEISLLILPNTDPEQFFLTFNEEYQSASIT